MARLVGPARIGQDFQRVFHRVGIEVANKQCRGSVETLCEGGKCAGLLDADSIGVPLTITIVSVRCRFRARQVLGRRSLGLEVVGNDNEVLAFVVCISNRLEFLSQGLTRKARVRRIIVNDRVPNRGNCCLLVDESDADDVLICGNGRGAGDIGPNLGSRSGIERIDEALERTVTVSADTGGYGVFNFFQCHNVGINRINRLNDLGLLVRKSLR